MVTLIFHSLGLFYIQIGYQAMTPTCACAPIGFPHFFLPSCWPKHGFTELAPKQYIHVCFFKRHHFGYSNAFLVFLSINLMVDVQGCGILWWLILDVYNRKITGWLKSFSFPRCNLRKGLLWRQKLSTKFDEFAYSSNGRLVDGLNIFEDSAPRQVSVFALTYR